MLMAAFLLSSGMLNALVVGGGGGSIPLASSYSGFQSWLPVIMEGIAVALSLTVMYYFLGVLLNNARIKGNALSEIQQVVGTTILVILILAVMSLIGSGTALSYQNGLGPKGTGQISAICNNILVNSQVGFLNSAGTSANYPQPYPVLPQPTSAVCSIINGNSGLDSMTQNIDYGLASTYVIEANLTNQSIVELNGVYNLDSLIFFLRSVISYGSICETGACVIPLAPRVQEFTFYYTLYKGYVFQRTIMPVMDTQANLAIYLAMTQLILILTMLIIWPYLLVAGILLRTFSLTRRAGGLIIAAVIVGTIIYPVIILFQYSSLNNLSPPGPVTGSSTGTPLVGSYQIPAIALCGLQANTQTLSQFTEGYPSTTTTQEDVFCYTSARQLTLFDVDKQTLPPNTYSGPAQQAVCAQDKLPSGPDLICACPTGTTGQFSEPKPNVFVMPSCYVQKQLSFYVFPDAASVIRLYACFPPDYASPQHLADSGTGPSGLIALENMIINHQNGEGSLNILLSLSTILNQAYSGSVGGLSPMTTNPGVPCNVNPAGIFASLVALINLYGVLSVVTFILPIINILMLLSATFGLSSILGGETNIIGLSRFI